jgi:hypothetical protein
MGTEDTGALFALVYDLKETASRLEAKVDKLTDNQHVPPCQGLTELKERTGGAWNTMKAIGAFLVGLAAITYTVWTMTH